MVSALTLPWSCLSCPVLPCPALPCPALPCILQHLDSAAHAIFLRAVNWTPAAVCLAIISGEIQADCHGVASMLPYSQSFIQKLQPDNCLTCRICTAKQHE